MKVTINIPQSKILEAFASIPKPENEIAEKFFKILVSSISVVDITETFRNNPQLKDAATVIALAAIATISQGLSNEAV